MSSFSLRVNSISKKRPTPGKHSISRQSLLFISSSVHLVLSEILVTSWSSSTAWEDYGVTVNQ